MISLLIQTIVISLSGVMAPGAITAATLAQGGKNRWAGMWISLGHGILEIPLIFILIFGIGKYLEYKIPRILIGLIGGLFLIYLGILTIKELYHPPADTSGGKSSKPVLTGFILSATNPYFLFWWATVGLGLAVQANKLGLLVLVIFAIVHWSLDLLWLTILSFAAFHGTNILGTKNQKIILAFCGAAMAFFGLKFLYGAIMLMVSLPG